jgi:hypothetical protein
MCGCSEDGSGEVEARLRRMSQWMFCARRASVDVWEGRIIQRTTRAVVKGLMPLACTASRNCGMLVEGARERRWSVQTGIVDRYVVLYMLGSGNEEMKKY